MNHIDGWELNRQAGDALKAEAARRITDRAERIGLIQAKPRFIFEVTHTSGKKHYMLAPCIFSAIKKLSTSPIGFGGVTSVVELGKVAE